MKKSAGFFHFANAHEFALCLTHFARRLLKLKLQNLNGYDGQNFDIFNKACKAFKSLLKLTIT